MAVLFVMTIPGPAAGLAALAALDRLGWWLRGRSGLSWHRGGRRPDPAPGLGELQAVLSSSTRHTIDQRRAQLVLRGDEHDAAPPHVGAGPGGRRAVITRVPRTPAS